MPRWRCYKLLMWFREFYHIQVMKRNIPIWTIAESYTARTLTYQATHSNRINATPHTSQANSKPKLSKIKEKHWHITIKQIFSLLHQEYWTNTTEMATPSTSNQTPVTLISSRRCSRKKSSIRTGLMMNHRWLLSWRSMSTIQTCSW